MYSQKDHVKMMNSFLFDEWSHVFQPEDDINEIWTRWKQHFSLEVESFIPCAQRTSQDRPWQPPWFNRSIGPLVRTENRLFNRARSSGLPDHWEKYKAARNKATNHIRMAKSRNYFQIANTLANPTCPPSKWWNLVWSMCGLKGHASNVIPPLSSETNVLVHDDKQKLKFWMIPLSIKTHPQLFTVSPLAQLKRILSVIFNTSPLPRWGGC